MKNKIKLEESHPLTWRISNPKTTVWLEEYTSKRGYEGLKKSILSLTPEEVIELVKKSQLKGRGGAGFFTGIKWSLVEKKNDEKQRYLLCNADEMEPGTYKDKFLMEHLPHQLLEGALISAFAIEASCIYIFLRGEYHRVKKILEFSIKEAIKNRYIGNNILGSDFNCNVFLHSGAGRYICGEETALINSLEGKRAIPRSKPPFPAISGLWGKPTCVNNVETLFNVPAIILNGVNWYHSLSKSSDTGTKMLGFSGKVNNPGLWELPLGISAREVLEKYAKGMKKNFFLKAWLPGGAGTCFLNAGDLDVSMDFTNIEKIGSRLGTGISIAVDQTVDIVALLLNLEIFFSRESCGWCTPCRDGLPWIVQILHAIKKGKGKMEDLSTLEELSLILSPGNTFCAHAPGAVSPLKSAMKHFRVELEEAVKNKK